MKKTVDLKNNLDVSKRRLFYETENTCPICKAKIVPVFLSASLNTENTASVFNYCQSCNQTFVTQYEVAAPKKTGSPYTAERVLYSEPNRFAKHPFDQMIIDLSPQFDKIYNQALAAESSGLDEIAGLGYRKALEFLVKDFAIHTAPSEAETIKRMPLSPCVKKYITDKNMSTLAERSAWIGNDEAHYVRKQEDRDVSDMKSFILALVYFVENKLVVEDALSMTPNPDKPE